MEVVSVALGVPVVSLMMGPSLGSAGLRNRRVRQQAMERAKTGEEDDA